MEPTTSIPIQTRCFPKGSVRMSSDGSLADPKILFDTFFPRPGRYRIWSQFQRRERLITVPFTIDVPRLQ
jgi:hypothetical protein